MDEGVVDRLSSLSDDRLRRILHLVPSKEAASTSALSRRWGSLWRSSGAVDLAVAIRYGHDEIYGYQAMQEAQRAAEDAFSRAAAASLAAAEVPVTRLAIRVDTDGGDTDLQRFVPKVSAVLSDPAAARHVEDLRVALVDANDDATTLFSGVEISRSLGICRLPSLPSPEILRVLDLTRCDLAPPPVACCLPRLATLRLRRCSIRLTDLQALLDAAPDLTHVHLESVLFKYTIIQQGYLQPQEVLDKIATTPAGPSIDAPRLQSFVYKGLLRQFQLRSAAPELARADLHFLKDTLCYGKERTRELFWQFVQSLSSAKALKLTVNAGLKEIAAIGKARRAQLLCPLPNVQRLELEGWHHPTSTTAAVAIANLLHCCHALGDLTLKLSDVPPDSHKDDGSYYASDRLDYTRSIDRFIRRRRSSTISMEDSNSSGVRYHDDVHDIPGLSGHSFACLQKSLRRVSLQFRLADSSSSCLGPRLVKFFAQNAMVLEEIHIDSGNWRQ
nr:unnamed protein product [Digitaria exilis]